MRVDLFDFELPKELIALRPASPRDSARLLVVDETGARSHSVLSNLPDFLRAGDVLVVNDSKVIPARLKGSRAARPDGDGKTAAIEATLLKRLSPQSYSAFVKPAKRLRGGDRVLFGKDLEAEIAGRDGGEVELVFDRVGTELDLAIALAGEMPLPPYIASKRKPDARDRVDYQTIFANEDGSVAAPTAGLHFTPDLLVKLERASVAVEKVTLHVGAGTFLPVSADDTADHKMHSEFAVVTEDAAVRLNEARAKGGRIVAVGTTALRTLESATDSDGKVQPFMGETDIFITPGYAFKCVNVLLTNFHLPKSTLFMLVAAFSGLEVMKAAYEDAIKEKYRFYSYGDACLLFRPPT
jgi:S-adenosylmethionine:tRNA ribosyltransferase-isomerase